MGNPTRVKGHEERGLTKTQRRDQVLGVPLDFVMHLPSKLESACLTALCFPPILLTLLGGYPRPPFSGKKLT